MDARLSIGSKSDTVVPRSTLPAVWIAPPACSRASNKVVLPAEEWPARATLRICSVLYDMRRFPPCEGRKGVMVGGADAPARRSWRVRRAPGP
jgi:hypothetical protein